MSANNFIQIDRKTFIISDCDADTGFGTKIGQAKTLDGALDLAQDYQRQNLVEYGIQFTATGENQRRKADKLRKPIKRR